MAVRVPGGGIQRYSSPQIESQVQRATLQDPSSAGFDTSRGIEKIGANLADVFMKQKQQADQLAVLDAKNKRAAYETELLYNPENGAFTKKGKNAFGTIEQVNSEYDKTMSEIENSLYNDNQKAAFRRDYQTSKLDINRQLNRHVSVQADAYDDETTTSGLITQREAYLANPYDNQKRTQSLIEQKIIIDQHATRKGLPDESRKLMLEDAENKTNLGAISKMVDTKDWIGAKQYFEDTKDSLTGEYRAKAERLVKESYQTGAAQQFTDEAMKKNLTLGQAYDMAAKEIQDPELRKATISNIRDSFQQRKEAEAYNADQINKNVASQIDRGTLWKDIPQTTKDRLSSTERDRLASYAADRAKGVDVPAGGKVYYDTFSIATNPTTRDAFMKENLHTSIYGKVSRSEFDELYKLQNGLKNGSAKEVNQADDLYSTKQVAEGVARSNGIYPKADDGESKQTAFTNYMVSVNSAVKLYETNSGKKANADDVKRIADSLVIQKKIDGQWFGGIRRFEALQGQNVDLEFSDIPASEVAAIREAARAQKVNLRESDILSIYNKRISGKR